MAVTQGTLSVLPIPHTYLQLSGTFSCPLPGCVLEKRPSKESQNRNEFVGMGGGNISVTSYWTLPTAYTHLEALGLALKVSRGERESKETDSQLTMPRHEFESCHPSSHMNYVVVIWFHLIGRDNVRVARRNKVSYFISARSLTTDAWAQEKVAFQAHSLLGTWKKTKCLETSFKGRSLVSGFGLLEQGTPRPEARVH